MSVALLGDSLVIDLPDFPVIPPAALARQQGVPGQCQITPLTGVGITNKMYGFGDHLVLRIPRNYPALSAWRTKKPKSSQRHARPAATSLPSRLELLPPQRQTLDLKVMNRSRCITCRKECLRGVPSHTI
jgi:hypothetical protein